MSLPLQISWTHALRKIVINCYKYHGREDLLPTFADDEDKVNALISQSGDEDEDMELSNPPTIHTVTTMTPPTDNSNVSIAQVPLKGYGFSFYLCSRI